MFNLLRRVSSTTPRLVGSSLRLPTGSSLPPVPSVPAATQLWGSPLGAVRFKQVKVQSYWKPPRAKPCGQRIPKKPHVGPKALPSEYCEIGRVICKQRRYLAKNPHVTRKRHFKYYPGVNVNVMHNSSLQAACSGRIKLTHDVSRQVMVMNVLAEPREELLQEDMWRYRTEHVGSMEENRELCALRAKAFHVFGKEGGWINQPIGPKPMSARVSKNNDRWNNTLVRDPLDMEPFCYPLNREQLTRHIKKVRARQQGMPEEDPEFQITDLKYKNFHGQTAQR